MINLTEVQATVSAPSNITVRLVRADHHTTANIFRICFEVFLALLSVTIGAVIQMTNVPTVYCAILIVCAIFAVVFVALSVYYEWLSSRSG